MKKYFFPFIVILIFLIIGFYIWTAMSARKKSESILAKFKQIDSSLSQSTDNSIQKSDQNYEKEYSLTASLKSEILIQIDSLKTYYENIPEGTVLHINGTQDSITPNKILKNIQKLNRLKWDVMDSAIPDTITFWSSSEKFSEQKWHSTNFENQPKFAVLTYLNYLRNQLLKIQ